MAVAVRSRALSATPRGTPAFLWRLFPPRWWWGWFEVVVLLGFLLRVDVAWGCEPGDAVAGVDGPLFFVDEVVVMGTEQGAVNGVGGAVL